MTDGAPRAGEGAGVVAPRGVVGLAASLDEHPRLLVGEEHPLLVVPVELAPGSVDVDADGVHDAQQVLALPGARPRGDRALADAHRPVGHHQVLGDVVDHPEPVAVRARARGGVGGEGLGGQVGGALGVVAGAGVEHPEQVGQGGHRAHARARARRAASLLERDGGRQPGDLLDVRRPDLLQQPPGVRRDRLEVAALGLGVDRAEGQRGLPGPRDAGEGDDGVPRDGDVDAAQVVLAGSDDPDVGVVLRGAHAAPYPGDPHRSVGDLAAPRRRRGVHRSGPVHPERSRPSIPPRGGIMAARDRLL